MQYLMPVVCLVKFNTVSVIASPCFNMRIVLE
jgi:hypothetical protein